MLSKHKRYYGLGMFGHGNTNGLGMDALVSVCCRNTKVIMVWTWMLCLSDAVEHGKTRCMVHQYFGPLKHLECVVRPTQATSGEVGQVCIFLRVYAPAEPITTVVKIMVEIIMDPPLLPPSPGGR